MDLLTLLQESGYAVPEEIRQCGILTEYAVESRYPGVFEEVLQTDYAEAVELAQRVVGWAESLIRDRGEN
jgi:HEPN domain-containing protein